MGRYDKKYKRKNGKRGIGFYSDKEEYGSVSCIASISLGEEREFILSL